MARFFKALGLFWLLSMVALPVHAKLSAVSEHILGQASAPITVEEFVSLTCSHCADFYNTTLPELEKRYVETGKVRFILRDYPLDGMALKAATLAHCMPAEQYYPFIKVLYKNQQAWMSAEGGPEKTLIQYAQLGGLSEEKAKACIDNTDLQDAVVITRTEGAKKYDIQATPTFVINNGTETLKGAQSVEGFAAVFDRLLKEKK